MLDQARNQIAVRDLTGAFATLKTAEALDPTSNELQSVAKMAASAREQERRRTETEALRRQIEAALVHEDYATAVVKAEEGLRKFPQEQSLLKLKALAEAQKVRVEQKRFVREQFATATSLVDAGQLLQAMTVLDRALQQAPGNSELETLRATLRDRVLAQESGQKKLQATETTLAEGKRILQERGARSAREFLDAHAGPYAESPQVRELHEAVRVREALDVLDSRLAAEPNPARKVESAEAALRSSPDNHWIRQRLADLQQIRAQISTAVDRAEGFEATGRWADALREWQQLRRAYPQVPEFEAQSKRVANLREESKKSSGVLPEPAPPLPTVPTEPADEQSSDGMSATRILESATSQPDVAATRATPAAPNSSVTQPVKTFPPMQRAPRPVPAPERRWQLEKILSGPAKYAAIGIALFVLAVMSYRILRVGEKLSPCDLTLTLVERA